MSIVFLTIMMAGEGWAELKGFACSFRDKRQFFEAIFVLAGACTFCEIHSEFIVEESTKLYNYQSVPGVLALLIKLAMFTWFFRSTRATLSATQGQQDINFYKVLLSTLTFWFLSVPVTVVVAWFLNPWHRYKLVMVIDLSSRLAGQALLTVLLCGCLSPLSKLETALASHGAYAKNIELGDHDVKLLQAAGQ